MVDERDDLPDLAAMISAALDGDRWLNSEAARAYLANMAERTFRQYSARPDFPRPVKLGKRLAWARSELQAWARREHAKQNRAA
jgi:predicted DNA-binding transcriptional regulator AlpA